MDEVMDVYRHFDKEAGSLPSSEMMAVGYKMTSRGSAFRSYMANCCAYLFVQQNSKACFEDLTNLMARNSELRWDALLILENHRGDVEDPRKMPDCDFHTHGKDIPCPRKKSYFCNFCLDDTNAWSWFPAKKDGDQTSILRMSRRVRRAGH